jgi:TonB family protein
LSASSEDPFDRFKINPAAAAPAVEARSEPVIATAARLDPSRAAAEPDRPLPQSRQRRLPFGPLGSLVIHLSPLLLLLSWSWSNPPAGTEAPIPVQLVMEEPPPPPPPPPAPAPKPEREPPRGRLASKDMGSPEAKPEPKPDPTPAEAAETPPEQPPVETQMAAVIPPPPPDLVSALPAPIPAPEPPMVSTEPKPAPPTKRSPKQPVAARPAPRPRRPAPVVGPDAEYDEYLAYCEMLIRRYEGMLPPSLLAGRQGRATLTIMVLGDGTIARVAITRSSGYQDIDSKIQQMVVAVRQFPPLPPRFESPVTTLRFEKSFP